MSTIQRKITTAPPLLEAAPRTRTPERRATDIAAAQDSTAKVQIRAYEIFQQRSRNGGGGDCVSDWLQAEQELNGVSPEIPPDADPCGEPRALASRLVPGRA